MEEESLAALKTAQHVMMNDRKTIVTSLTWSSLEVTAGRFRAFVNSQSPKLIATNATHKFI